MREVLGRGLDKGVFLVNFTFVFLSFLYFMSILSLCLFCLFFVCIVFFSFLLGKPEDESGSGKGLTSESSW